MSLGVCVHPTSLLLLPFHICAVLHMNGIYQNMGPSMWKVQSTISPQISIPSHHFLLLILSLFPQSLKFITWRSLKVMLFGESQHQLSFQRVVGVQSLKCYVTDDCVPIKLKWFPIYLKNYSVIQSFQMFSVMSLGLNQKVDLFSILTVISPAFLDFHAQLMTGDDYL